MLTWLKPKFRFSEFALRAETDAPEAFGASLRGSTPPDRDSAALDAADSEVGKSNFRIWVKCEADDLRTHLGERILLLGCPGSGKTTLGKQLGPILNLQLFQLDDYYWKEDGTCRGEDEWLEALSSFVMRESWIIAGNHVSGFEMRIKWADSVILLAPSTQVCLWRVLKRGVTSLFSRNTSPAFRTARSYLFDLNPEFLFRVLKFNRVERKLQFECLSQLGAKVIELKNNEAIDDFLYALRIRGKDQETEAVRPRRTLS